MKARWIAPLAMAVAILIAAPASAVVVTLTAGDGFGASSFNSAGNWSPAGAPSAGNDYFNGGFLLRTPADGNSYTFAGDSLTVTGSGLATAAGNDALMWKGIGTTSVITVNNLTLNGGQLRHGQGDGDTVTFAGNIAIGANGGNIATQGGMIITANITGSNTLRVLPNGNGAAARTVTFASSGNTFNGDLNLYNGQSRWALADDANLNFTIGAAGVNNSINGGGVATINGDFVLDLSGAGTTNGDSWTLVSAASKTFGSTFTVAGFSDIGGDQWELGVAGGSYLFDEASGVLSYAAIPEASSFLFGGVACVAAGLSYRRRRRNA